MQCDLDMWEPGAAGWHYTIPSSGTGGPTRGDHPREPLTKHWTPASNKVKGKLLNGQKREAWGLGPHTVLNDAGSPLRKKRLPLKQGTTLGSGLQGAFTILQGLRVMRTCLTWRDMAGISGYSRMD